MVHASCSCGIDIHAHVVPEHFPAYLGSAAPSDWPSTAPAHACHRHVLISGKVYRTVNERCWSTTRRIEDMDTMGVSLQVISPMPELLSYWMAPAAAQQLIRYINEQLALMVAESNGRLCALGAVPLQDMDLALAELDYVIDKLGFAGVEIGSNINGKPPGDPSFAPFFAACEAKGAAVFVHALRPAGKERLVGPAPLQQALGYPTDVGLAAASVLTTNLIERFPKLRIAFSHGGGTLAALLPRLEQARRVFPALQEAVTSSPSEQARRLYYDALVFDTPTLQHLLARFGASQLMIGTDYPFAFHERQPLAAINDAVADPLRRAQLITHNAERFLGLPSTLQLKD
jgi:aminocarboxymuconate-semialdehyde decarboxylase